MSTVGKFPMQSSDLVEPHVSGTYIGPAYDGSSTQNMITSTNGRYQEPIGAHLDGCVKRLARSLADYEKEDNKVNNQLIELRRFAEKVRTMEYRERDVLTMGGKFSMFDQMPDRTQRNQLRKDVRVARRNIAQAFKWIQHHLDCAIAIDSDDEEEYSDEEDPGFGTGLER